MRRLKKTQLGEPEINLTPLIDVCFVILIMFIVIAPILNKQKVELAAAGPNTTAAATAGIRITVSSNNSITINEEPVSVTELANRLSIAKSRYGPSVQLMHDKNASFGTYQAIKNALEVAGFTEMDLILKNQ